MTLKDQLKLTLTAFALLATLTPAVLLAQTAAATLPADAVPAPVMLPVEVTQAAITVAPLALTPALERAIALGVANKNANHALVLRDSGQGFANAMAALSTPRYGTTATKSGLWLEVYTPLSWVSQQAAVATREYREFVLEYDMVEPVVRIYAHPDTPSLVTARGAAGTRSVQRVVLQNHARTTTVQPLTTEEVIEETKNAMGGSLTYTGQIVTFALADVLQLRAEGEFDIILVGTRGEKRYTVKKKHFERLPL